MLDALANGRGQPVSMQDVYRDNVDGMPFKMGVKGILSGTSTKLTAENINWINDRITK